MAMTREALCRTAPGTRGLMAQPRSLDRAGPALFAMRRQAIRRTRSLAPEPASCIAGWYATQARNGAFSLGRKPRTWDMPVQMRGNGHCLAAQLRRKAPAPLQSPISAAPEPRVVNVT